MEDRNINSWIECLPPVVFSVNTSSAREVDTTLCEIVFKQKSQSNFDL